ncbi:hypothetical protein GQ54DRAFT_83724 [Martensiomyces pterosporus]|nr:hypothetical protein GQ54DRAFT_83724 [Martensiomyces pterosporus]
MLVVSAAMSLCSVCGRAGFPGAKAWPPADSWALQHEQKYEIHARTQHTPTRLALRIGSPMAESLTRPPLIIGHRNPALPLLLLAHCVLCGPPQTRELSLFQAPSLRSSDHRPIQVCLVRISHFHQFPRNSQSWHFRDRAAGKDTASRSQRMLRCIATAGLDVCCAVDSRFPMDAPNSDHYLFLGYSEPPVKMKG